MRRLLFFLVIILVNLSCQDEAVETEIDDSVRITEIDNGFKIFNKTDESIYYAAVNHNSLILISLTCSHSNFLGPYGTTTVSLEEIPGFVEFNDQVKTIELYLWKECGSDGFAKSTTSIVFDVK